ncbi:AAA-domain-containing protein [Amylocystis lapponica]|nr:AAA-domain-containing protein [Amylocystis lapponica]
MDFLFAHPPSVGLSPSVHERDDDDTVLISEDVWKSLQLPQPATRVSLSISRYSSSLSSRDALLCWGIFEQSVAGLAIPKRWSEEHRDLFFRRDVGDATTEHTHNVTVVHPVVLSEVILSALDSGSYAAASSHKSAIEDWFMDKQAILRQGSTYTVHADHLAESDLTTGSQDTFRFYLAMSTPVLQGIPQRGTTRFYVIDSQSDEPPSSLTLDDALLSDAHSEADSNESQKEGFEIDEGFLASSVLHSMSSLPSSSSHGRDEQIGDIKEAPEDNVSERLQISAPQWTSTAEPLSEPVSLQWDDCTVYVRTTDLGRIGILNGDWAVVRAARGSSYRLVRVCVNHDQSGSSSSVSLSPQLLHNVVPMSTSSAAREICLRSSPFGSKRPTIPSARAITIARVASPFTTDRAYQPKFLRGLQDYFKRSTRLVKQGDVIVVKIDTALVHRQGDVDPGADDPSQEEWDDLLGSEFARSFENADEAVFFVVTNIEHSVIPSHGDVSSLDLYVGSTVGELGCWVDPAVTRITQTGVEHSRVPDTALYLGLAKTVAPMDASSPLIREDSAYGKLLALSSAALTRHAVDYQLQLSILLQGPKGVGKYTVASWVAQRLGIHLYEVSCYDILGETPVKTEGTLRVRFERAASCSPCILYLRDIDAFAQTTQGMEPGKEPAITDALQECITSLQQTWSLTGFPVLVFASTSTADRVPSRILSCFKHEITFEVPGESERHDILMSLLRGYTLAADVSIREVAVQTAALVAADLVSLVGRTRRASVQRAIHDSNNAAEADLIAAGIPLIAVDFEAALNDARASYSENIGAPKIPSVSWDDVGGLAHIKADILDTIQLPLEHPEMFADGLKKRSGILLYGPPGTGKTLLAKAVATSCALNFFSVKGPELLNMYIGESEANVRRVFQRARDARPCVIFFDELDSVAPKRGSHGDSGGVMDRIVSQILAELDGLSTGKGGDVFVIGATNRPDLLDPALLRPGRFDRMLYLGVSDTHAAQLNILQALTRKFRLHPELRLEDVAERCPFNYTGADFYALCADALLKAMSRKAEELEAKIAELNRGPPDPRHPYPLTPQYYLGELATAADIEVLVSQDDFDSALRELVPSVSQAEMEHYAHIQRRFSKETINGS